jgi:tetratricopeptide (TPR) repeat protein
MLPAVAAAGRWLKPGGRFCPSRLTLQLAPAGNLVLDEIDTFRQSIYGVDLAPAAAQALRRCYRADLAASMLLAPPLVHAELAPPDVGRSLDGTARFVIERPGELRVVAGWFDAALAPGVRLTNAPGTTTHWGQHLFPLPPTDVEAGDVLELSIRVLTDRSELAWIWSGTITRGDRELASFHVDDRDADQVPAIPPRELPAGNRNYLAKELNALGVDEYRQSRWREAWRLWDDAVALLDPRDDRLPPLYENLGMALAQGGRRSAAIRALLRALDGDPASREQARRFLDELGWTPPV